MAEEKLKPVHPGEVLLEEFLKPMSLSQNRLALAIGMDTRRINEIVLEKRSVTADTACGWRVSSARRRDSGWGCRRTTTWMWLPMRWNPDWRARFGRMR